MIETLSQVARAAEFGVLAVVAANGAAAILLCLVQLWLVLPRNRTNVPCPAAASGIGTVQPFVSVHLAIYDEPPALVGATLARLAALRGADFEVLVIDNNTPDETRWRPVEAAAGRLGHRFRFYHFDGVEGAKAGALNLALGLTDARASHIAVVDADYQVHPDFLGDALTALRGAAADYVQFPQAYRRVEAGARGVERELGDYFACFAGGAGQVGTMLLTGTLSVIEIGALRSVGGWSPATITEDAELGWRLQAAGRRGIWLPSERGNGLLPLDFDGLQKQRARWVAGNMQVLRRAWQSGALDFSGANLLTLFAQLTAWVSLWLVPATALGLLPWLPPSAVSATTGRVAAATILVSALLTAARMLLATPLQGGETRVWLSALVTKLALTWTAALAWLPVFTGRRLFFYRTSKDRSGVWTGRYGGLFAASLLFAGATVVYSMRGEALATAACSMLAAIWPCSQIVDARLRGSAATNLAV